MYHLIESSTTNWYYPQVAHEDAFGLWIIHPRFLGCISYFVCLLPKRGVYPVPALALKQETSITTDAGDSTTTGRKEWWCEERCNPPRKFLAGPGGEGVGPGEAVWTLGKCLKLSEFRSEPWQLGMKVTKEKNGEFVVIPNLITSSHFPLCTKKTRGRGRNGGMACTKHRSNIWK